MTNNIKNIDWVSVFAVINSVKNGSESKYFGTPSVRFGTSEIVSEAIEKYSNGILKYEDGIGYDFYSDNGLKIECKSESNMLYKNPAKGKIPIMKDVIQVKLKNLNGSSEVKDDLKIKINKFDCLLLLDTKSKNTFSVGYIMQKDITNDMLSNTGQGQIIAKIPKDKITILIGPEFFEKIEFFNSDLSYKEERRKLNLKYIESCKYTVIPTKK